MKTKEVKKKEKLNWNEIREKAKKNFKRFLNKTKKSAIRIWNFIKRIAKQAKDKFMELPKKIRLVIYVWGVVLFALLIFILATSSSKKFYNKYATFEDNLSAATLSYVENKKIFTTIDKKIIIDLAELKTEKYISSLQIDDDTCEGYSVVYYDDNKSEYIVDSYLNCKRYTSKYYWDYK